MNKAVKIKIIEAIKADRPNVKSDARHSVKLDINKSQYSRLMNGELDVLSDSKLINIAYKLDVSLGSRPEWKTAKTPVFNYVYQQLAYCKKHSISAILCDNADIGKSYAAKIFAKENPNTVYIDCSQYKTKQKLIRAIAREFGVSHTGRYDDVYNVLMYYINSIDDPLIILDEAGDLNYNAFLELKAGWNATEHRAAWYMIGADGLKRKIDSNKDRKKVGYTEIFSRFGGKYQKIAPEGKQETEQFNLKQVAEIAKANGANNITQIYAKTNGSLRRIYTEIQKQAS